MDRRGVDEVLRRSVEKVSTSWICARSRGRFCASRVPVAAQAGNRAAGAEKDKSLPAETSPIQEGAASAAARRSGGTVTSSS